MSELAVVVGGLATVAALIVAWRRSRNKDRPDIVIVHQGGRRLFTVDVGKMSTGEAQSLVNRMREEFLAKCSGDEVSERWQPLKEIYVDFPTPTTHPLHDKEVRHYVLNGSSVRTRIYWNKQFVDHVWHSLEAAIETLRMQLMAQWHLPQSGFSLVVHPKSSRLIENISNYAHAPAKTNGPVTEIGHIKAFMLRNRIRVFRCDQCPEDRIVLRIDTVENMGNGRPGMCGEIVLSGLSCETSS